MTPVGESPVVQHSAAAVTAPRRFQFSLRALLLLMVVASAFFGWVMHTRRHIEQRRIALEKLGAFHWIDPQPIWRQWLLGDDTPRYAHEFSTMAVADSTVIAYLTELAQLESLTMGGQQFMAADLNRFRRFTRLKKLSLLYCPIADTGLAQLCKLDTLDRLWLVHCGVTDAGVIHLKRLQQLKVLQIDGSEISDQSEIELQQALPQCKVGFERLRR